MLGSSHLIEHCYADDAGMQRYIAYEVQLMLDAGTRLASSNEFQRAPTSSNEL